MPDFKAFQEFWVDKPQVAFIRVRDGGDLFTDSWGDDKHQDWRRNGIALALYEFVARDLASKGMVLYASDLQEPEDRLAWDAMEAKGYPVKFVDGPYGKVRRYLDYR